MGHEIKATLTKVTPLDVAIAFSVAAEGEGLNPNVNLIAILLAHSALETGHWAVMRCYNFGNVKATNSWIENGGSWTFYEASENLNEKAMLYWVGLAKPRTDGKSGLDAVVKVKTKLENGAYIYGVWFYPSHIQCRFRAFEFLEEGAAYYLSKLNGRYASALKPAKRGDVYAYVNEIYRLGYFTANLQAYRKQVAKLFNDYLPIAKKIDPVERYGDDHSWKK